MGHGLAAIAVGGSFRSLEIFADASGLAYTAHGPGWRSAAVSLGGLLAPPILGAAILAFVHGPRRARVLLTGLAGALVLSLPLWVRGTVGLVTVPLCALLLGWVAWRAFRARPERRGVAAQVLGVVLAEDTLTRMVSYAFTSEVTVGGEKRASDIAAVAQAVGGHWLAWGALVTVVALGLLALGLWRAWRAR